MKQESYFDGGLLSYVSHRIIASLITICTLGICAPWGICIMVNWKVKHTVIKWLILTIITIGIYSFWLNIKLEQWITTHTHHLD